MKILLDNGHGEDTPGKRSPDGLFREYRYVRDIAQMVESRLLALGYDAERIVTEEEDISLSERTRRVNEICGRLGSDNVVVVSIHCNAASNGKWAKARGWSAYTSKGETRSDELATMLYIEAAKNFEGQTLRKEFSDGDPDWEEGFYILRKTKCPAVLTENFFMDNELDVAYLNSEQGKEAIVKTHINAIREYVAKYEKD